MLAAFEYYPKIRLVADVALDEDLVAVGVEVLLDFHAKLYLFALGTWQAFFRAVLVQMLLQFDLSEFLAFGALIWALMKPGFAVSLQMAVQLFVAYGLLAAMRMIWTFEFEAIQLLLVELVNLARCLSERVAAVLLVAGAVELVSASLADDVLARSALHGVDDDVGALGAEHVLVDLHRL